MKKTILFCFFLIGMTAENAFSCDLVFVPVTTSCGVETVASGCTTQQIIDDTLFWENHYCGGGDASLPPG
jgi:hypothetical protein